MRGLFRFVRLVSDRPLAIDNGETTMVIRLINQEDRRLRDLMEIFRRGNISANQQNSGLLLMGLRSGFSECLKLIKKYDSQSVLASELQAMLERTDRNVKTQWRLKNRRFELHKRTYLMGILNVTPDSFSDGGLFLDSGKAVRHALRMAEAGADIIDIGGESTRPGAEPISREEELSRVIPVIEGLKHQSDITISIDTYKADVAKTALDAGADIINDISGLGHDPSIADLAAEYNAGLILMHIKGNPKDMQVDPYYSDVMEEILEYLATRRNLALSKGVRDDQIVIDPGIGFGKRWFDNYDIINRLQELKILGSPILVGASRKSFLRKALLPDAKQRLEGTLVSHALAISNGANIVRVHDVKEAQQAARASDLFKRRIEWPELLDLEPSES